MTRERATALIREEMRAFERARSDRDMDSAWLALERAHIVSQPYLVLHLVSHWEMLKLAIAQRDRREAFGQLLRLALAPLGALTGRIPVGNTGRSNVSAFRPMAIPEDLKAVLKDHD